MPAAIPDREPTRITAGETLAWRISLPDYPASEGFVLKYALQCGTNRIAITSTADGDVHAVNVSAATSAAYTPGNYLFTSYVETGTGDALERYTISAGLITILPSPLEALPQSHAAQALALIEAAIIGRIPNGLESTEIDGQRIDRIPQEKLLEMRKQYRIELQAEKLTTASASGQRQRRTIGFRFVRP